MSYQVIFAQGTATVAVPAGEKIAVQAFSPAQVFQEVGFPNFPEANDLLTTVDNTTYVSGAFTNATNVIIQAGASGAYYSVGVAPDISNNGNWQPQGAPANIADGKVFFDVEFTPPFPAEHITFRSKLVNDYIEEIL